jgi:hypothetical protein
MVATHKLVQGNLFKAGWILLLVVSALMTLNHLILIFVLDQPTPLHWLDGVQSVRPSRGLVSLPARAEVGVGRRLDTGHCPCQYDFL